MKFNLYKKVLIFFITILLVPAALAISPNQYDDFEIGSTQGWGSGAPNPNLPQNISSGGPLGVDDNYLQVISIGGSGAGSRLVIFNSAQWSGNFSANGVQSISMYIKNFSDTTLSMRIVIRGPGGDFWSAVPVAITSFADWQPVTFSLLPSDLTGGTTLSATLGAVSSVRILHSDAGGVTGNPIAANIGLDNISASAQPLPFQIALTSIILGFFDGSTMIPDTVKVEIRNSSSPHSIVDQQFVALDNLGQGTAISLVLENSTPYFFTVKHRNSIETWSAVPQQFSLGFSKYDFTTDSTKAFGDNLKLKGSKWCIINGDCNQDAFIDASDYLEIVNNWEAGDPAMAGDTNGDQFIDGSDYLQIVNIFEIGAVTPLSLAKKTKVSIQPSISKEE